MPPNSTLYIPRPAIHALSSGGAELVSCLILTPAEVLKQNAQVWNQSDQKGGKSGNPTLEVIKQFRSHPTKLFRGYTTLAARNLPFTGLQFPLFEHLKSYFLDRRKRAKRLRGEDGKVDGIFERARITALSAGLAGTGAAWITTPIDVVKTRVMLAAGDEAKSDGRSTSSSKGPNDPESKSRREPAIAQKSNPATSSGGARQGAFELTKQIVQTEGVRGLFRGAMLRSVWTALGSGLYLGAYEGGRFWLEERRKREEGIGVLGGKGTDGVRKDWKGVKVGIGRSRSQGEKVGRSAWEE